MKTVAERTANVLNGLLPATHVDNQFSTPDTLAARMAYYQTPGVSIAVIHEGAIEWAQGFGVCEIGQPAPVTPETLFQAGSISKPIFALAVMRLVEQGILDLDEDVNHYLTTWQVPANGDWQPRLTLRQLLSHTAGLTVHGFPGYPAGQPVPTVTQVLDGQAPANTAPVRVNLLPGMQFRYAGGGTTVAQQVVVDVLGKPFPEIMDELVLQPADVTGSTYAQPPAAGWLERTATAHPWNGQPLPYQFHLYPEMAAAGLWSTPTDLARLGLHVQRALNGDTNALLQPATARQMLTPQTRPDDEQIGIGFFLMGKDAGARFGHGGWDEGFIARLTLYREGGFGCAIMLNSNQGHPLADEIERAIAKEYNWPDYFPEQSAAPAFGQLAMYVGTYYSDTGMTFTVTETADQLWLHTPGQAAFSLQPTTATQFTVHALNAEVNFAQAESNQETTLTFQQGGRSLLLKKQTA